MSNFESVRSEILQLNQQVNRLVRDIRTLRTVHAHRAGPEYQADANRYNRVIEELVSSLNIAVGVIDTYIKEWIEHFGDDFLVSEALNIISVLSYVVDHELLWIVHQVDTDSLEITQMEIQLLRNMMEDFEPALQCKLTMFSMPDQVNERH